MNLRWTQHAISRCTERLGIDFKDIQYAETSQIGAKRRRRIRRQFPGGKKAFDRLEAGNAKDGYEMRFHEPTESVLVLKHPACGGNNCIVVTILPPVKFGFLGPSKRKRA